MDLAGQSERARHNFASQSDGVLGADPSVNVSPSPAAADAISCKITQLLENEENQTHYYLSNTVGTFAKSI